ncbi:phage holin family protein [Necropsobacter massiliensis]|uniref:phage holin family protein n=1 Tax=Necropsobacter massiliensis TaxID=1400001 RepID=UPI000595DAE8|nr:phage holin family protein [Necropsobacter massiliensis]
MQIITKIKRAFITSVELAQIRLHMLSIELIELKNSLLAIFSVLLLAFIALLTGLISLLFGLEHYLTPESKTTVFFSISAAAFLLVLGFILLVLRLISRQRRFMLSTLSEIQRDVGALKHALGASDNEREV